MPIKRLLVFSLFVFISSPSFAQSQIGLEQVRIKNDSASEKYLHEIRTVNGSLIIAEVLKVKTHSLIILSNELGESEIRFDQIESIQGQGKKKKGSATRKMVGVTHYLLTPTTPYGLEKGEVNLQNSEIFLWSGWYGFSKIFSLGGGFSLLPERQFKEQFFYLIPKLNFQLTPNVNLAVQYTQIFFSEIDNTSLLSVSAGFGKIDRHISVGYTTPLFANGRDVAFDTGLINIGSVYRLGNKFALLADINFPYEKDSERILGLGGRIIGKKFSVDLGFVSTSFLEGFPLPWVNFTFRP